MTLLTSKWLWAVVGAAILLTVLYFAGRKTFHAEIVIPASPQAVWAVLSDHTGYADWNPLLVPIAGSLSVGSKVTYRMTQPNGKQSEFEATIIEIEPGRRIRQFAGLRGVLTADHEYRLEAVDGGTRVIQHEVDNGLAMLFWDSSWVQPSYERVNEALRARVMELAK
ncbi:MAG: SRPBCC domain-containing protein [Candidatus Thiodiazotropha lotti]|nr:SRPBCC domain-containing protein [Candidatus Thiodiazotropha lotti]MCG8001015.1 SRPBCC domain-containing protein [Candidatus Thiodiazotropha lotti]MCW4182656.1 SRPBCC domain-containing protein [Candidatus Thiodiazotropha weberae]MCW4192789.1 SRPBCC domain-containing protein [Candidatus Thiodiazotropha weberae]